MVLTKVANQNTAVSNPVQLSWFRGFDGNAWVNFKYGSRDPVVRPAHGTLGGVTFYGAFGPDGLSRSKAARTSLPVDPAPAGGHPAFYMFDGNYYFGTVSDEAQRMIAQRIVKPFVVVAVG